MAALSAGTGGTKLEMRWFSPRWSLRYLVGLPYGPKGIGARLLDSDDVVGLDSVCPWHSNSYGYFGAVDGRWFPVSWPIAGLCLQLFFGSLLIPLPRLC